MTEFSALLRQSAEEVRTYCARFSEARQFDVDWLLSLARRMEVASALESDAEVEREIEALAYSITDSAPLATQFVPSFHQALDALQRRRKRDKRNARRGDAA